MRRHGDADVGGGFRATGELRQATRGTWAFVGFQRWFFQENFIATSIQVTAGHRTKHKFITHARPTDSCGCDLAPTGPGSRTKATMYILRQQKNHETSGAAIRVAEKSKITEHCCVPFRTSGCWQVAGAAEAEPMSQSLSSELCRARFLGSVDGHNYRNEGEAWRDVGRTWTGCVGKTVTPRRRGVMPRMIPQSSSSRARCYAARVAGIGPLQSSMGKQLHDKYVYVYTYIDRHRYIDI